MTPTDIEAEINQLLLDGHHLLKAKAIPDTLSLPPIPYILSLPLNLKLGIISALDTVFGRAGLGYRVPSYIQAMIDSSNKLKVDIGSYKRHYHLEIRSEEEYLKNFSRMDGIKKYAVAIMLLDNPTEEEIQLHNMTWSV